MPARTDNAVDIAPALRIVPQLDFHATDKDDTSDVFEHGNGNCHKKEEYELFQPGALNRK